MVRNDGGELCDDADGGHGADGRGSRRAFYGYSRSLFNDERSAYGWRLAIGIEWDGPGGKGSAMLATAAQ